MGNDSPGKHFKISMVCRTPVADLLGYHPCWPIKHIPLRNALLDFAYTIHDTDVKSNLKNAATAQEVYFADHGTYTSDIGSLKGYGYNQSFKVTLTASATPTTFVIIGTTTKGCKVNTGTWHFISTTGAISGTPCSRSR